MANPATTAVQATQDERIPGLPVLPASTDPATLTVPVYNPATDKTHQAPLGGPVAVSNAIIGAPKLVQYTNSRYYGVPAGALTLDRLDPATIVPGTLATVDNPSPTPLATTLPPQQYVATVVAAGTAGAVLVPHYIKAPASDTVSIIWQKEGVAFAPVTPLEVPTSAHGIVGLGLHDAIVWLANHLGTAVSTAPTITGFLPMSGAQGDTVVLTGTGFLGASLVSINNGGVANFNVDSATQITALLSSAQTTGKVRVTVPNVGTAVSVDDFTVTTAPAPLVEYPLEPTARQACSQATPYLGGDLLNTLAYYEFETAATLLDLQAATGLGSIDSGYANTAEFGIYVGASGASLGAATTFSQRANLGLAASAGTAPVWVPVAVPATAGKKRYRVAMPAQVRHGAGSQLVEGVVLLKLRANAPITWVTTFPAYTTDYLIGEDSIAFSNPVNPWTDAWVVRLRERVKALGGRVVVNSIAGASLTEVYGSQANKAAYLQQFASTASQVVPLFIYGTNDAIRLNATPADFGTAYAALLDDLHTAMPAAQPVVVTPFTVGVFESQVVPLRNKAADVVGLRSFARLIPGPPAFAGTPGPSNPGDPDDGQRIHPGTVQMASIENYLWGKLNNVDPNLFSDTFPGTTLNPRWLNTLANQPANAALVVVNNELRITATVGAGHQQGVTSALPYSLLAYAFQCGIGTQFVQRPESVQYIGFHADGSTIYNGYQLAIANGIFLFSGPQFTTLGSVAYDAVAQKYLRFKGATTQVVPQTSPDGVNWTNPFGITDTSPFDLANVRLIIGGGGSTSTDQLNWPDGTPLGTCSFIQAGITPNAGGGGGTMTRYPSNDATHWSFTSGWGHSGESSYVNVAGEIATITATGTRLVLEGANGPSYDNYLLSLDGGAPFTVSAAAGADAGNQLLWDSGVLSAAPHTLTVQKAGSNMGYNTLQAIRVTA